MKIALLTLHSHLSRPAFPLAAACLAAALSKTRRQDVQLIDLFPDMTLATMRETVLACDGDLVAFPLYSWNRHPLLSLARELRRHRPQLRLVACGPEATADAAGVLAEGGLDGAVFSNEETPFGHLVEALAAGSSPAGTAGLLWQTPSGAVTGPPDAPSDPEALPSPWLTGVLTPAPGDSVPWEITRGGAFASDLFQEMVGRGIHHLPAERLQAELELFVKTGVAEVRVLDPAFNFPPERGQRLLRLLAERAPGLRYILEARADFLDRETVRLLSQLACSVRLDLISARPDVLRLLHRTFDPELFASQIHLLASEGVEFSLALFWGLQGDNLEGFRQSLDWALSLAPQRLDLFPQPDHPGHLLYRHRAEFGLIPTRSEKNRGESAWSLPELETCRRLAAATDLFYNQGRAAPFFGPLLQATNSRPALFLEEFAAWATGPGQVEEARFFSAVDWPAEEILLLQENYLTCRLQQLGRSDLVAAAVDLIRFHYHHTQMQAEPETTPLSPESLQGLDLWETRWRKAPQARLVPFSYEVLGLQECRDINLEDFASLFRPVGSVAIFLRRDGTVLCESLAESFLRLLQESNGERSPREIFSGSISRQEGEEIVECAVEEGFLVRA